MPAPARRHGRSESGQPDFVNGPLARERPFSLGQVCEACGGQPNVASSLADLLGEAAYREEHLDQLLGLGLLVVGDAVTVEVLDRGGVGAADLALLAQGA